MGERLWRVVWLPQDSGAVAGFRSRNVLHTHPPNMHVPRTPCLTGIYYTPGSLKARLCVRGKQLMYTYCQERDISHRRIGKLIVAASGQQLPELGRIRARAEANGVSDLSLLDKDDMHALEPELKGAAALLSPSTGIVDSHGWVMGAWYA